MAGDHELASEWARCSGKNASYITVESIGEMKLMMKFYLCLHNFSEL